jgi:hypothetical protein
VSRVERARRRRDALLALPPAARRDMLGRLSTDERRALRCCWEVWAHEGRDDRCRSARGDC